MKIDIVLMASGSSERFGADNKLLHRVKGKPIFSYALDNALELREVLPDIIDNITVVSRFDEIKTICEGKPLNYVYNESSAEGISASIHIGVEHSRCNNSIMFMVCDQIFMRTDTLIGLVKGYIASGKSLGCISTKDGDTANPCIFAPRWREALMALSGDRGGKSVIKNNTDSVYLYDEAEDYELTDTDTMPPFDFTDSCGHIVSLVGAGGKTTIMYSLAQMCRLRGMRTLVTTTTHIFKPDSYTVANSEEELEATWARGEIAVVGESADDGKLTMPQYDKLKRYMAAADIVLIEADGAKRMPLKVPEVNEPVILSESDIVIAVAGIDSLDRRLKEVCFRLDRAKELLKCNDEHIVSKEDIATILASDEGGRKCVGERQYYAVINKCDNEYLRNKACEIKDILNNMGIKVIISEARRCVYE